ncbi:MAG: hypothetical protein ACOX2F_00300 [bacterium]
MKKLLWMERERCFLFSLSVKISAEFMRNSFELSELCLKMAENRECGSETVKSGAEFELGFDMIKESSFLEKRKLSPSIIT